MIDKTNIKGGIDLIHTRNGIIVSEIHNPNTVLTIGKSQIAAHMVSDLDVGSSIDWMAIGLGSSTITAGDTTLGSEYMKLGNGDLTGSTTTTITANDTAFFIGSFVIDATKIINEAGLFNASGLNTGSMYARTCFTDISCVSGDSVNINWKEAFA
jgi:hypothetical protein